MEELCEQMGALMSRFVSAVESLDGLRQTVTSTGNSANQLVPTSVAGSHATLSTQFLAQKADLSFSEGVGTSVLMPITIEGDGDDQDSGDDLSESIGKDTTDHVMTTDSYGKLRYSFTKMLRVLLTY